MLIYKATNIINNKCYIGQTIQSLIERIYDGKNNPNAKTYLITHPNGTQEIIECLKPFCKQYNLGYISMSNVVNGKQKHHKSFVGHPF